MLYYLTSSGTREGDMYSLWGEPGNLFNFNCIKVVTVISLCMLT